MVERKRRLLTEHIEDLRDAFRKVEQAHPFHIDAIVILPDHLHALWTLPEGDDDFSLRWRQIKSAFFRAIGTGERISKSRTQKKERGIWQRRFWEHLIRGERDFSNHLDYIHFNPVKHGYVTKPDDWAYSSIHRYIFLGVYSPGWTIE